MNNRLPEAPDTVLMRGGSLIVSPLGQLLAGPLWNEEGIITATVDQQPYSQGFYAVTQLVLYLKYGLYPSDMNTGGMGLVDISNVAKVKELVGTIR